MNDDNTTPKRPRYVIFRRPAFVRCEGWIPAHEALQVAAKVFRSEQRAKNVLLSAILDRTLDASTRAVMDDYDLRPVPRKVPAKKNLLIKAIWYSGEGQFFRLEAFGSLSGSAYAEVEVDFAHSQVVALHHPNGSAFIDPEDGEITIKPRGRRVHFNVEVNEDSLRRLLAPYRKNRVSEHVTQNTDPDSDGYRVKLTESEWNDVLLPLLTLARSGRLQDEFGVIGRGDKQKIKDEILRLLEEREKSASASTLRRKCNTLIAMNEQARSASAEQS